MHPLRHAAAILASSAISWGAPAPLEKLENCTLVKTGWADGDSFLVRTADGKELTVRLYGADCIEYHVTDESDARRLREQRRYFGISGFGGAAEKSIALAKSLGGLAAEEVVRALGKPFTVHTSFADARGDGRYQRIYGFVTTADGEDLASHLVKMGLARAFGVYKQTPLGKSGNEYRAELADLELRAARLGKGAWKKTDWDQLPEERRAQREEEAELEIATGAKREFTGSPVNINSAARDELMRIPGIGEVTANRIIEGRPYDEPADLQKVEGIGARTAERLLGYLDFGKPR
ncbi:helix-hairpin-helix domain-containing protein [Akkermansiaceae bacterium]|nr:helix-hairpin-helix domain-containing protein [Akkermansiaceae bacterium]